MITGRGKVVAIISGAVVVGILLTIAALWKDFAVRYHLDRLRSTPDYFFEIADRPEGSAERLATESFAQNDEGAKLLLSTLLAHFKRAEQSSPGLSEVESGVVGFGNWAKLKKDEEPFLWHCFIFKTGTRRGQTRLPASRKAETQRHVAMHPAMVRLLPRVPGQEWTLVEYPGFRFTVLTADAAFDRMREPARKNRSDAPSSPDGVPTDFEKFSLVILVQRVGL